MALCLCCAARAGELPDSPLSEQDVQMYVQVLQAAEHRAHHPGAADRAAARTADAARVRQRRAYDTFQTGHKDGHKATPDEIAQLRASDPKPEELAAMRHTDLLQHHPDALVAEERQLQPHYEVVRKTIERWLALQDAKPAPRADLATLPEAVRQRVLQQQDLEAHNAALIKPHLRQIRALKRQLGQGADADLD